MVLAVLDLLIWATLWNVPNPMRVRLPFLTAEITAASVEQTSRSISTVAGTTVAGRSLQPVRFASKDGKTQAAMLRGAAPGALPRSRVQ